MLSDLASPDSNVREQALEAIEAAAMLGEHHVAQLFAELAVIDPADEVATSYRALGLSIVIRIDAAQTNVLQFDGDAHLRLAPLVDWWAGSGALPGPTWHQDRGWVDSVGHGAELAGAVGQHPTAGRAVVLELATTAACLAATDRRFLAHEGERLALAFALLTDRRPEVLDELPGELWPTASPEDPTAPGWEATLNVHAFLRDLATIWQFGVSVPEAATDLPAREAGSREPGWLRRALAHTDTSGLWRLD